MRLDWIGGGFAFIQSHEKDEARERFSFFFSYFFCLPERLYTVVGIYEFRVSLYLQRSVARAKESTAYKTGSSHREGSRGKHSRKGGSGGGTKLYGKALDERIIIRSGSTFPTVTHPSL